MLVQWFSLFQGFYSTLGNWASWWIALSPDLESGVPVLMGLAHHFVSDIPDVAGQAQTWQVGFLTTGQAQNLANEIPGWAALSQDLESGMPGLTGQAQNLESGIPGWTALGQD